MCERDSLLTDVADKLQQLNDFGKANELSHAIRNELNGLSLAFQSLLLQAELNLPVDSSLLNLSAQKWQYFLTLKESVAEDRQR